MHLFTALALEVVGGVAVGLLAGKSGVRRALCGCAGLITLVVPYSVRPGLELFQFYGGLVALIIGMRAIDLMREPFPSPVRRVAHVFAVFDSRLATRQPRRFDARALGPICAWSLVALGLCWLGLVEANRLDGVARLVVRWTACAWFALASVEALVPLLVVGWGAVGVRAPPMLVQAYRSRTVSEFWGTRWNRVVSVWLELTFYRPLANISRPRLGRALSFVASALMHWYLISVPLGFGAGVTVAAFFVLQVPLLALERKLRVRRWPVALGRAWTLSTLLLISPLATEPLLRMADPWVAWLVG